jgi:hypothetical protein
MKLIRNKSIYLGVIASISLIISATILVPQVQGSLILKNKDDNILNKISSEVNSFFAERSKDKFISFFSKENNYIDKLIPSLDPPKISKIMMQKFIGFFNLLITLPILLLKGIISGAISLLSGLIRTVLAIIKLTILSVACIQGALTFTGIFIIFLGLMTKFGFKIFSIMASPVFSVLVLRIIPAFGTLLGGLSLIIHSVVGLAIISALPVLLIILVLNIVKIVQSLLEEGLPTFQTL